MCSIEFASAPCLAPCSCVQCHCWSLIVCLSNLFSFLVCCLPGDARPRHARAEDASWFAAIFDTSTFSSKSHSVNLILLRMMFYGAKGMHIRWDKEVHVKYWRTGEKQSSFFMFKTNWGMLDGRAGYTDVNLNNSILNNCRLRPIRTDTHISMCWKRIWPLRKKHGKIKGTATPNRATVSEMEWI